MSVSTSNPGSAFRWLLTALVMLAISCGTGTEFRETFTESEVYSIRWAPDMERLRPGVLFGMDVTVTGASAASSTAMRDVSLSVTATMPSHGDHGMDTRPQITRTGDGTFRVDGMRFTMPGRWDVAFVVDGPAGSDRAVFTEYVGH